MQKVYALFIFTDPKQTFFDTVFITSAKYYYLCSPNREDKTMDKSDKKETYNKEALMRETIRLATENVERGGGPFGAIIADKKGQIVATGVNQVTVNNDPTAHAEIEAIQKAAAELKTFNLSGYDIYASCEPCPMCLGAIYWAHIDRLFYANTKEDAQKAGFDDSFIYKEMALKPSNRRLFSERMLGEEAFKTFENWMSKKDKTIY